MSTIRDIRELTGLSHEKLAAWLGVSKSLVQFAETGERKLQGDAATKLTLLSLPVQQLTEAAKMMQRSDAVLFLNPADFAQAHKKKMNHHLDIARRLQRQLDILQVRHMKLTIRLALLHLMENLDTDLYRSTGADKHMAGLLEFFGRHSMSAGFKKIEKLQDRIDTHRRYAEVHEQSLEKFAAMGNPRVEM